MIEVSRRLSAFVPLKEYCTFSLGPDNHDYIEVCEWANMEGYDIDIEDRQGSRHIKLTYGQFLALKKAIKKLEKQERV
jgi:hypothetical protein